MNALKQKIYISGPISGLPEPKVSFSFRETERVLRELFPSSELVKLNTLERLNCLLIDTTNRQSNRNHTKKRYNSIL